MLDPRIILAGEPVNALGAINSGTVAAQNTNAVQQQNALAGLYREQGPGILAGDPGAMNALSGIDPQAAMGMQQAQLGMQATRQTMARLSRDEERAIAAEAAKLSADQRQAEAQKIEEAVKMGLAAPDAASWDRLMQSIGAPEMVGAFDQRQMLAQRYMSVAEILKGQGDPLSTAGKLKADLDAGRITQEQFDMEMQGDGISFSSGPDGVSFSTGKGQNVGVKPGTVPQGYSAIADPAVEGGVRYVPSPGGPVEAENRAKAQAAKAAEAAYDRKYKLVDEKMTEAIKMLDEGGSWVAGFGSALGGVPESDARTFKGVLATIKANLGFEELQAMREASPTGGALGQVTEREIAFLQSMEGALDQAQSPDALKKIISDIQTRRQEFNAERAKIMQDDKGGGIPPAPPGFAADEWPAIFDVMTPEEQELFR